MSATAFQRMRRFKLDVSTDRDTKTEVPDAGENVRESISRELKEKNIPHSLRDAAGLARHLREGIAEDTRQGRRDREEFVSPLSVDAELQAESPGSHGPRNTREQASIAEIEQRERLASVTVEGGRITERMPDDRAERVEPFSAEVYSPPTSVDPGTHGAVHDRVFAVAADPPPKTSADPDADEKARDARVRAVEDEEDVRAEQGERRAKRRRARGTKSEDKAEAKPAAPPAQAPRPQPQAAQPPRPAAPPQAAQAPRPQPAPAPQGARPAQPAQPPQAPKKP